MGVQFPGKKRYVTLEWPLNGPHIGDKHVLNIDMVRGHSSVTKRHGGWGCQLSRKKCYEGVRFNVISVTKMWVGQIHWKKVLCNT